MLQRPGTLYDFQRFLAARDARDASKLGALWGLVHTVRWPFAMAIAVLAIQGLGDPALDAALRADPETALPVIIARTLPVGLVGFMLAALLSGFLATFSSTVNGGAAYLVKDVYLRYGNPRADERTSVRAGYMASVLLIAAGLAISALGSWREVRRQGRRRQRRRLWNRPRVRRSAGGAWRPCRPARRQCRAG